MRQLSASQLDLAAKCSGPFVLPCVEEDTPEAERGTEVHRQIAEWIAAGSRLSFEPDAPTHPLARIATEWLKRPNQIAARHLRTEVAYALTWDGSVRELGLTAHRQYTIAPGEIPGTADLIAHTRDGSHIYVVDWKTGQERHDPATSRQLLHAAYCVAQIYADSCAGEPQLPKPRTTIAFAYLTEDGVDLREHEIDPEDWPRILDYITYPAIKRGLAAAQYEKTGQIDVRTGLHCQWCPAKLACPATRAGVELVRQAESELPAGLLRPEEVATYYRAWLQVKLVGGQIEQAARLLAADGLLPGYRLEQETRQRVDGATAYQVLIEAHGIETARAACEITTSKGAIRDAIRKHSPHAVGQAAIATRNTIREISERGGIGIRSFAVLREHDGAAEHAPPIAYDPNEFLPPIPGESEET